MRYYDNRKSVLMPILWLSVVGIATIILIVFAAGNAISYNRYCEDYLKRAADANTINIAKVELKKAVDWIESKNLTSGYTSVLYNTPDEDLGFWYNNLKTSLNELENFNQVSATPTDKSNQLIKLRETLLDTTGDGTQITAPAGISRYPNNTTYMFMTWAVICGLIIGTIFLLIRID